VIFQYNPSFRINLRTGARCEEEELRMEEKCSPRSNSPIVVKNKPREWLLAVGIWMVIFCVMLEYHRWRGKPYSLFTADKATAISSALLVCFALGLGPLYRITGGLKRLIRMRRPLGMFAVVMMAPHMLMALFFLPHKFDLAFFLKHWLSFILGMSAFIGFVVVFAISFRRGIERLGRNKWKSLQRFSYVLLLVVLLHFMVLGKPVNWVRWFAPLFVGEGPPKPVPPGTFVPFFFGMLVMLVYVIDRVCTMRKKEEETDE